MENIYKNKKQIVLKEMIEIYKPTTLDWMSYLITKKLSNLSSYKTRK